MQAHTLTIDAKQRQGPGSLASLADFTLSAGAPVDAEIVRTNPQHSLYCLDDVAQRAIFVELPEEVDLSQAPFVYQTQYDHAQRLVAVPYAAFVQMAADLPPVNHLIMTYMTGRSGSTLVSHLFNEVPSVLSLSEPDVATQFVHLRATDGSRDGELQQLLDASVRFLFKSTPAKHPTTFALKLRSEGTQVLDLYQAAFPNVRNLFLYRDAIGWVASFYRLFQRAGMPASMPLTLFLDVWGKNMRYDFQPLSRCLDAGTSELSTVQLLTLWWLATMEWALAKQQQGFPLLAVDYAHLNSQRRPVLTAIFDYCGLPTAMVEQTLGVFAKDAQAGSSAARDKAAEGNQLRLNDQQLHELTMILQRHPVIKTFDFRLPGTLVM